MIERVQSISRVAEGSYQVVFAAEDGALRVFQLAVDDAGGIQCVKSGPDLQAYFGHNMDRAAALYEAVLVFHRAVLLAVSDVPVRSTK